MKKYDSYKDSGVKWIGEIPKHWRRSKTNFLSSNYDGKRVPLNRTQRSEMEGEIPYWGSNGVVDYINKSMFNEELVLVGEDGSPFFDIYKPISFKVTGDVWINNHIHVLKHKESEVLSDFLVHSFNITDFKEFITGSTRDKLTQSDLSRIPHFLPPLSEQQQIVSFLDTKTSLIDSLTDKTQRKIELLKEKRTSIINEVVTKGLNPNEDMKDSGVEWIGEIPIHWNRSRLDFLFRLYGRLGWKSLKSDEYVEDGYVFLSTPNIKKKDIDYKNVNYITKERYNESPEIMLENGDVLLVKDGSTLGIVNIVENLPRPTTVNSSIGVLKRKSDKITSKFMYYHLSSYYHQNIINRIKGGMGVPHLFQSDIKKFVVLLPPISEQQQIVEYLDEQTQLIDKTISIEEKRIELLKEYRQSLISEVVTGKRKVV